MEILQDTIIKLIIRQGPDADRQAVILTSGEQGYSTTTKRVYVGDGGTFGGHLVGNLYKGDSSGGDFSGILNPVEGDLSFNTDNRKLYRNVISGDTTPVGWSQIGGVYVSGDNYIKISADNIITLNALSGGSLSPDTVQYPITLSGGKISLPPLSAGTVSEDLLRYPIVLSGGKISLPPLSAYTVSENAVQAPIVINNGKIYLPPLSAGTVANDLVEAPIYLNSGRIALSANIPYERVSTKTITVSTGLLAYVDGVDVTGTAVNPLSSNIIIKSQTNQLLISYDGLNDLINYSRGGISVTKNGVGDYTFNYGPLPTSEIYPFITIMGLYSTVALPTSITNTTLDIDVTDQVSIAPSDATLIIQINY